MEIILGIEHLKRSFNKPVIALGNFDGVHLGHQEIFRRVREEALKIGGEAIVVTFEPHPLKVLSPSHCPPLLTPFQKKMTLIEKSGILTVFCIEFTVNFSNLSPNEFVENILVGKITPRKLVVGYNYHFGRKKSGDSKMLKELCKHFQIDVEIVEPFILNGMVVSSSRVRALIKNGEMEESSKLLGRDYFVTGKVIQGAKRGKALGFPTANLALSDELYPPLGVYAVEVVWNHLTYHGVANLGKNLTFQPAKRESLAPVSLEVHLLDFDQMIYGEEIQINFRKRIRNEVRFESAAQLLDQIRKDIAWAQENVFGNGAPAT
jgi:riboflavin kinase / FMN adenylyltransferase